MIKSGYVGFLILVSMMIIFFALPDPEGLQKPFRVILGLSFAIIYFALLIKKEISLKTLWPLAIGCILIVIMIFRGTFQTCLINIYLCMFGLLCIPHLYFNLTPIRKTNLNYIHVFCILSLLLQFFFYSSGDGRPKLAYEINLSGAYLFLFFIASDILNNKHGKLLVIVLSLFTLSRLLIFSILLYYLIKYSKKYFKCLLKKLNATSLIIASYIFIAFFSFWYVVSVKSAIDYDTSINRIATLNDGSNKLRFLANTMAIASIYKDPLSAKTLLGSGSVENFIKESKGALIIPHNELFDAIIEFGLIMVIFFALFSFPFFDKVISYSNVEYLIPILFYTLILWVRFILVPSFEMIFILFVLNIVNQQKLLPETNLKQNAASHTGL